MVASDSFADKERAVSALGKLGDSRGVAVLTALQDGHLLRGPESRVLISDAAKLVDPISGVEVPGAAAEALDQ